MVHILLQRRKTLKYSSVTCSESKHDLRPQQFQRLEAIVGPLSSILPVVVQPSNQDLKNVIIVSYWNARALFFNFFNIYKQIKPTAMLQIHSSHKHNNTQTG